MGENSQVEFKEKITNTFLKTVCAFANYNGGEIYFGIDDNGNTVGIGDTKQARLNIENMINDNISPIPDYTIRTNEKMGVIVLTVIEGLEKPYFYKAKTYKRNDTATIPVDRLELMRLILEGKNMSYEELPASDQNLSFDVLEKAISEHLGIDKLSKDVLITLELCNSSGEYNKAAELLADSNTFAGIDAIRFGSNISVILDRETIQKKTILSQYQGMVDLYTKYYQYEEIKGSLREKRELIPEKAFREAIANALVHRTWDVNANISVSMYEDRIEIVSPGGLPKGITKEEYLRGGISMPRNPIICNVFMRLDIIERFGTGIRRIIETYKENTVKPQFSISENSITIILPRTDLYEALSDDERLVMEIFKRNGKKNLSSSEIANYAEMGKTKVVALLNGLVEQGYIQKTGAGRGVTYSVERE